MCSALCFCFGCTPCFVQYMHWSRDLFEVAVLWPLLLPTHLIKMIHSSYPDLQSAGGFVPDEVRSNPLYFDSDPSLILAI